MPHPGQPGALHFDNMNVSEFLCRWNIECEDFGLTDPQKCTRLPDYCTSETKDTIELLSGYQACERTERTEIEYCSDSSRGARGCSVSISVRPSRVGLCSVSSRPIPNRADLILGSVCSARGLPCISINLNL